MDTHVDSCTYTKKLRVNLYIYSFTIPFALLYDKVRGEKSSMCSTILNTSPLLTSRHVCPFSRYHILVSPWLSHNASGQTKLETTIPSGTEVNISSSWRRKSQSRAIAVTRHTIWCTRTHLTTTQWRVGSFENQSAPYCVKQLDTLMV